MPNMKDIAARVPVDGVAARVTGKGVHYEPSARLYMHWDICPPLKEPTKKTPDYRGRKFGLVTVVGLWAGDKERVIGQWEQHWKTCPEIRNQINNQNDLTGSTFGRLVVVGSWADNHSSRKSWVVRCSCGCFELRRAKVIKDPSNYEDSCLLCGQGWWIVRCVCGRFEKRREKSIINPKNNNDRCSVCRNLQFLKKKDEYRRLGYNTKNQDEY
jgi:hypothetical protein